MGEPTERTTAAGATVTNFRIASSTRRKNLSTNKWEDGRTLFLSVVCFGDLARNVAVSAHKGESVIVNGRLTQNEWQKGEQLVSAIEVIADAVGHNLTRGVTRFERLRRSYAGSAVPVGDDGMPIDVTDAALEAQMEQEMRAVAAEMAESVGGTSDGASAEPVYLEPLPDSGPLVPIG